MKIKPIICHLLISASVSICFFSISSPQAFALSGADFAVYNDSIAGSYSGTWSEGVTAVKNMLSYQGFTYEEITYNDLNSSTQDFSSLYKAIIVPGGFSYYYNYWISKAGKERIRSFVNNGGGYLGICAGAFFAVDKVVWEDVTYDDTSYQNSYGELSAFDLNLVSVTGTGPITKIADWNTTHWNMTTIDFSSSNILSKYKTAPFSEDIIYIGGPYFSNFDTSTVKVLATYQSNSKPAVIMANYGSGTVVLFGPHPEIEEDNVRDGVVLNTSGRLTKEQMNDNGTDWELMRHVFNELVSINSNIYQSITPPTSTTVAKGGVLGPFYISATNIKASAAIIMGYATNTPFGERDLEVIRGYTTINPSETKKYTAYMFIKPLMKEGMWTHTARIYNASGKLIDSDSFSFTVTSGTSTSSVMSEHSPDRVLFAKVKASPHATIKECDDFEIIMFPDEGKR